jgi:hypothetical protein
MALTRSNLKWERLDDGSNTMMTSYSARRASLCREGEAMDSLGETLKKAFVINAARIQWSATRQDRIVVSKWVGR